MNSTDQLKLVAHGYLLDLMPRLNKSLPKPARKKVKALAEKEDFVSLSAIAERYLRGMHAPTLHKGDGQWFVRANVDSSLPVDGWVSYRSCSRTAALLTCFTLAVEATPPDQRRLFW